MNNYEKHAYIMMVHNEWRILKLTIEMLDDERNDFFIHVDLKVNMDEIPYDLTKITQKSRVFLMPRMSVTWGGDSQVECEMKLLEAAAVGHYWYYHFISGVDMPLMDTDHIFSYFRENDGINYFEMHEPEPEDLDRIRYYHFFQNKIGKGLNSETIIYQKLKGWGLKIQKMLHVNRIRNIKIRFYKGEIWFSITDELMQYIVSQRNVIKQVFSKGWCADELCWESIAMQAPCADTIINDCMRYVDWELGDPYIFQIQDFERIINSGRIFARKFSDKVDSEIVNMIYKAVTDKEPDNLQI